jgi:hypothetical protein
MFLMLELQKHLMLRCFYVVVITSHIYDFVSNSAKDFVFGIRAWPQHSIIFKTELMVLLGALNLKLSRSDP